MKDLLINDEWDDVCDSIEEELQFLNIEEIKNLPESNKQSLFINRLIRIFEEDLKNKLQEKGFEKDLIDDPNEISWIINQGDYFNCPENVLKYSPDKKHVFLDAETESGLRSLLSLFTFKDDIENIILTDNEYYKVFLRTFLQFLQYKSFDLSTAIDIIINIVSTGSLKHIKQGHVTLDALAKGADKVHIRAEKEKAELQKQADEIWKKFSSYSVWRVAGELAEKKIPDGRQHGKREKLQKRIADKITKPAIYKK